MHYQEVNILGVYVGPFAPLMLVAWLLTMPLWRLSSRIGLARWVWHTSLFNFAVYAIVLCLLTLLAGAI